MKPCAHCGKTDETARFNIDVGGTNGGKWVCGECFDVATERDPRWVSYCPECHGYRRRRVPEANAKATELCAFCEEVKRQRARSQHRSCSCRPGAPCSRCTDG